MNNKHSIVFLTALALSLGAFANNAFQQVKADESGNYLASEEANWTVALPVGNYADQCVEFSQSYTTVFDIMLSIGNVGPSVWVGSTSGWPGNMYQGNFAVWKSLDPTSECGITAANYLGVANQADQRGYLKIESGTYKFGEQLELGDGNNSTGIVYQTGGTMELTNDKWAGIGYSDGGYGRYVLDGEDAALTLTGNGNSTLVIGRNGATGELIVTNGAVTAQTLLVGEGTETVNDEKVYSKGSLSVFGGTVTLRGELRDGSGEGSTANVEVGGGSISVGGTLHVGYSENSTATLTIDGGRVDVSGDNVYCCASKAHATINLNGGILQTKWIQKYWHDGTDVSMATLNFNGGTLKAKGDRTSDEGFIRDAIVLNVKGKGAVVDTDGHDVTINGALPTSGAVGSGGMTKKGSGTLTVSGTYSATGDIKVEGGTLVLSNPASGLTVNSVTLTNASDLNLNGNTITARSLTINGEAQSGTVNVARGSVTVSPVTVATATWTGEAGDNDPTNCDNWTCKDGEGNTLASAVPTSDTTITVEGEIDADLSSFADLAVEKKILKLTSGTVDVAVSDEGTVEPRNLSDWYLDARAATLNVVNARMLGTAAVATAITSAGIDGRFANVTSDDGKGGVKVSYGNDGAVGVSRRGGFVIVIQ